jgi:hypothetical protein
MQFIDLALEGSRLHSLAQPFDAVHLGFYQAAAVVPTPIFSYLAPQPSAYGYCCMAMHKSIAFAHPGILSGWADTSLAHPNGAAGDSMY